MALKRRVFVSLTEEQVIAIMQDIDWATGVYCCPSQETKVLTEAFKELGHALDAHRDAPHDAAGYTELHDPSSTDG